MNKQRKLHRRATAKLSELGELIAAADPAGREPANWAALTMTQRKEIARLLMLIANDIDLCGEYFESVKNSPGQPEIRQRKFFADLDYRLGPVNTNAVPQ